MNELSEATKEVVQREFAVYFNCNHSVSVDVVDGAIKLVLWGDDVFETYSFKILKKTPPSITWLKGKISQAEERKNKANVKRKEATDKIRNHFADKLDSRNNVYITSFGFSVENLFRDGLKDAKQICDELSIEYSRMEYSQAHWVVRVFVK